MNRSPETIFIVKKNITIINTWSRYFRNYSKKNCEIFQIIQIWKYLKESILPISFIVVYHIMVQEISNYFIFLIVCQSQSVTVYQAQSGDLSWLELYLVKRQEKVECSIWRVTSALVIWGPSLPHISDNICRGCEAPPQFTSLKDWRRSNGALNCLEVKIHISKATKVLWVTIL